VLVSGLKDMGSEMVCSVTLLLCLLNCASKWHNEQIYDRSKRHSEGI